MVLDFIKSNVYKLSTIVLVVGLAAGAAYHLTVVYTKNLKIEAITEQNASLESARRSLTKEVEGYKITSSLWQDSCSKQNELIKQLMLQTDQREAATKKAAESAKVVYDQMLKDAEYWKNKPQGSAEPCTSFFDKLDSYVETRK